MRVLVSGAVLGACLLAFPPTVEPDVEHRAVELTAPVFDDAGMADVGALVSSLIS